jgi:hypothetical protein
MKALFYVLAAATTALGPVDSSSAGGSLSPKPTSQTRPTATPVGADAITSTYLDQVESLIARRLSPASTLLHLQKHLDDAPMSPALRNDMTRSVAYLAQQTNTSHLTVEDAQLLRLELVDARIQQGVLELQRNAIRLEWSPSQLYHAVMNWLLNTPVFNDAPSPQNYRLRTAAALELSMLQHTGTTAMGTGLTEELLRQRLATAIRRLDASLAQGTVTQTDYDRFKESAVARTRQIILQNF